MLPYFKMAYIAPFLVFFGALAVEASPTNWPGSMPVQTITTTTTTTTVFGVTVTRGCTPNPTPCSNQNGCNPPPVCGDQNGPDCTPPWRNDEVISSRDIDLVSRNNGACGENNAVKCPDGTSQNCTCQAWGWECLCPTIRDRLTTVTQTSIVILTRTYLVDSGPCPTTISFNPPTFTVHPPTSRTLSTPPPPPSHSLPSPTVRPQPPISLSVGPPPSHFPTSLTVSQPSHTLLPPPSHTLTSLTTLQPPPRSLITRTLPSHSPTRTLLPLPSHSSTKTFLPVPTLLPAPGSCPSGTSHEILSFDDFYDDEQFDIKDPVRIPDSPFEYRGFTFDPDWAFAFCENLGDHRDQTCSPTTLEGDYYISLYYHLPTPYISRVSRRITYDVENDQSSWEALSYSLSAFPKPGQIITVLMCAWSIHDQENDIEPTFCQAEYFTQYDQNILRTVEVNYSNQELAFIEFTGYDGYYSPGSGAASLAKGLSPAEFFLDDMNVCIPSRW